MAEQVQVIVRIRPLNEKEKKQSTLPVVSASSTKNEVTVIRGSGARQMRHVFKFDGVFSGQSTQAEVFDHTLRPMIHDVLNGFESTVFAYGQTGTGKTHTMLGHDLWALAAEHESGRDIAALAVETEERGIIPRAMQYIFDKFSSGNSSLKASYLELYNERIRDLLAPAQEAPEAFSAEVYTEGDHLGAGLDIREDRQRGIQLLALVPDHNHGALDFQFRGQPRGGERRQTPGLHEAPSVLRLVGQPS